MATMPAVAMRMLNRTTDVIPCPRATNVTAVAQPSAASTKNCQGWNVSLLPSLVEVFELIVEAFCDLGIFCRRGFRRRCRPPRPADRDEPETDRPGCCSKVRN